MENTSQKGSGKLFPNLKPDKSSGNVFTSLFDKSSSEAKKDDIVESVVKQSGAQSSILGPRPDLGGVAIAEKPVSFGWTLIKVLVFLFIILLAASYLTMGSSFSISGLNQTIKVQEAEQDLKTVQAGLNTTNYLIGYYYLDNFVYLADSYIYKTSQYESDYTSDADKNTLETGLSDLETQMLDLLTKARENLVYELYPEDIEINTELSQLVEFKEATAAYVQDKITELETGAFADDADVQLEITGLYGVASLLDNTVLINDFLSLDLEEEFDYDTVAGLYDSFSQVTQDNFTVISGIKSNRQNWSDIISEIEEITQEVDPLYGTSVESDIEYTSYSLAYETKTISIQGETATDDSRSFTLISNLIDAFEGSEMFMNVNERTFTKSEASSDEGGEYQSNFSLEFEIQEGEDPRDDVTTTL